MSLPQRVRAASADLTSSLQAAGYQAFKGNGLPLAMTHIPARRRLAAPVGKMRAQQALGKSLP